MPHGVAGEVIGAFDPAVPSLLANETSTGQRKSRSSALRVACWLILALGIELTEGVYIWASHRS